MGIIQRSSCKSKYVPDEETVYTYNLQAGQSDVFLFSRGDGEYQITVNENIEGNRYSQAFAGTCQVALKDQLTPFYIRTSM